MATNETICAVNTCGVPTEDSGHFCWAHTTLDDEPHLRTSWAPDPLPCASCDGSGAIATDSGTSICRACDGHGE